MGLLDTFLGGGGDSETQTTQTQTVTTDTQNVAVSGKSTAVVLPESAGAAGINVRIASSDPAVLAQVSRDLRISALGIVKSNERVARAGLTAERQTAAKAMNAVQQASGAALEFAADSAGDLLAGVRDLAGQSLDLVGSSFELAADQALDVIDRTRAGDQAYLDAFLARSAEDRDQAFELAAQSQQPDTEALKEMGRTLLIGVIIVAIAMIWRRA